MLEAWAARHGVSAHALADLRLLTGAGAVDVTMPRADHSEAYVQSQVRLEAARKGVYLFRNNVGALLDERGRPVRYGLANDSKALNARLKSSDLIGFRPVTIGPERVGTVLAQFVSRECKRAGWRYTGDAHEQAQANWINLVAAHGGDARFTAGEETL